jgi:hypothetical protein
MARHSCGPKGADSRSVPSLIGTMFPGGQILLPGSDLGIGFLVHFEGELLKRAHRNFSFRNGSIGNYFLAAAQGFFRSLPSAVFLFSSITGSQVSDFPCS